MMSKPTFRRFIAYIIDIIIISLIVGAFSSIKFLNPKIDEYNDAQKQYQDYITELSMTNPAGAFSDEKAQNLSYDVTYYGVYTSIISLVITFLYFSVFQYYTKGKTIGKLAMGIELISTDKKELRMSQVIIHSAIIDSILTSSLLVIATLFLSKTSFMKTSLFIQILDLALVFISIAMIIYRDDGIGLHDKLAHTRVVVKGERPEELIKEAEYTEKDTEDVKEKVVEKKKTVRKAKKEVVKKEDE